jgi:1-acyl-sn-glycerol-3-phosphate acyltransferase
MSTSSARGPEEPGPGKLLTLLRTAVILAWVGVATIVIGALVICLSFFSRSANPGHRLAGRWARSILAVSGIRVSVRGLERIDRERAYIFMSNHMSNFDIPVLLGHLPVQFRWLAKAELFRIPLFGRAMRAAGYISIDRSNRAAAFDSLEQAAERTRRGASIMIFPEGTRSLDGNLKAFKKGGFVMAIAAGVPIVPVVIRGTHAIMPKSTLLIRPRDVTLEVQEPIDTAVYTPEGKEPLMERVRAAIGGESRGG